LKEEKGGGFMTQMVCETAKTRNGRDPPKLNWERNAFVLGGKKTTGGKKNTVL